MLAACGACTTLALSGCASTGIDATSYRAVGQDSRVQFIIVHFTAEPLDSSLRILTQQSVSSHYLVTDEARPRVLRLVDEDRRAWHAGVSHWAGHGMLNGNSVGIEIVNLGNRPGQSLPTGPEGQPGFAPFPAAQVEAVVGLIKDIARRHQVRPDRILGHSDIAPQRKVDPGPQFPWKRLADEGLIAWPDAAVVARWQGDYAKALPSDAWFQRALFRHGFLIADHGTWDEASRKVLAAFQMKYRPSRYDGQPDAETAALLTALTGYSASTLERRPPAP